MTMTAGSPRNAPPRLRSPLADASPWSKAKLQERSFIFPQFAHVHHCCSIQLPQREHVHPIGLDGLLPSCSLILAMDSTTLRRGFNALEVSLLWLLRLADPAEVGRDVVSENLDGRSVVQASQMRNWIGLTRVQMSQVQVSGVWRWSCAWVRSMGGLEGLDGSFAILGTAGARGACLMIFSTFAWSASSGCSNPGDRAVPRIPEGLLSLGGA